MAAATAGGGGGLRSPALHVGDGTARRAAYNDARTAQIRALESGALAAQRPLLPVVTVPAASVVVDEDGPNYRPPLKRELYGILLSGGPWGDGCSVAVAAPTAVSSGLVHLVGLQSRHTPQKVR